MEESRLHTCNINDVEKGSFDNGILWKTYSHPLYSLYCKEISGKWVYHDEPDKLEQIASDLVFVIAMGLSFQMKVVKMFLYIAQVCIVRMADFSPNRKLHLKPSRGTKVFLLSM